MVLPKLTEAMVRQGATGESFERGYEYYDEGAVLSLIMREGVLHARVEGSEPLPYSVRCIFSEQGVISATCSCPYDRGGWCKHIVATLLAVIREPESIEERQPLATLLNGLAREQLQSLLLKLVELVPSLQETIEEQVSRQGVGAKTVDASSTASTAGAANSTSASTGAGASGGKSQRVRVDANAIRRQVGSALHSLDRLSGVQAYYGVSSVVDNVSGIVDQAWAFIEADDGRNALAVLEAVTDEYVAEWEILDDSDGYAGDFFNELGRAWTEAILTADLSKDERESWIKKLDAWQLAADDYGVDEVFMAAQEAAARGWDYPPLQDILQGRISDEDYEEEEEVSDYPSDYAGELTTARLNVLERRGQWQQYLNLAKAEGQVEAYTRALVNLGRVEEAVAYGLAYLNTAQEALGLAKTLREKGRGEESMQIAEYGLMLPNQPGSRLLLATWLREEAAVMGDRERALAAAEITFQDQVNLANYLRLAELAGEQWPEWRPKLLNIARTSGGYVVDGKVDVFLHEGLVDDAIAALGENPSHTPLEKVVDAAIQSHPDWVIKMCKRQAEYIMDNGKSQLYGAAARWLSKARQAYLATGRTKEWQAYLDEQLREHSRKYSLVPLLKPLR